MTQEHDGPGGVVRAEGGLTERDPHYGGNSYEASMLRDLLARIHGDGGHYVAQHGMDKALEDAAALVGAWRATEKEPAGLPQGWVAVPESAAEWFSTCPGIANHDWRSGWDACRNRIISLAAAPVAATPEPAVNFDTWQQNPYTKVLQKSIAEDYVPRHAEPHVVAVPMLTQAEISAYLSHSLTEQENSGYGFTTSLSRRSEAATIAKANAALSAAGLAVRLTPGD